MAVAHGSRADNTKAQREIAGLTITGLARKANVSDQVIKQLETAAPPTVR
jgi:ribosome-binding protein aMBF1 (putative translation factor)